MIYQQGYNAIGVDSFEPSRFDLHIVYVSKKLKNKNNTTDLEHNKLCYSLGLKTHKVQVLDVNLFNYVI